MEVRARQDEHLEVVRRPRRRAPRGAWSILAIALIASGCAAQESSTVSPGPRGGTVPAPTRTFATHPPSTSVVPGHSLDPPGSSTTRRTDASTTARPPESPTTTRRSTRTVPSTAPPATRPAGPSRADQVLTQLATVPVKGRAPKTGYRRDQFGPAWTDDVDVSGGHNGCDTRNDILRRDLTDLTYKAGTHDCIVVTGILHDPYTAKTIFFQRGQTTSTAVQIDHVVALSDAWQKGAQQLDATQRRDLANDPIELLAVDGPTNGAKGDGDAATWLPPNKSFRCRYVTLQVAVKVRYHLWMTQAEHDAIRGIVSSCSDAAIGPASG